MYYQLNIYKSLLHWLDFCSRVTHIAKKLVGSWATSFSHPFYLVIHENAKKVEKKYHLGVKGCHCFLCSSFTKETRRFWKNIKFEPFPVLPHAQTPSKSIRHQKLHGNRYQKCPNWTIFGDFELFSSKIIFDENRGNCDMHLFHFELKNEPFFMLTWSNTIQINQALKNTRKKNQKCFRLDHF